MVEKTVHMLICEKYGEEYHPFHDRDIIPWLQKNNIIFDYDNGPFLIELMFNEKFIKFVKHKAGLSV